MFVCYRQYLQSTHMDAAKGNTITTGSTGSSLHLVLSITCGQSVRDSRDSQNSPSGLSRDIPREGCNREAAKCCTYSSAPAPLGPSYLNSSSPPRNPAPETGKFSNTLTSLSACFPRAVLSNNRVPIFRQLFCCDALMSKRDCQQAWS